MKHTLRLTLPKLCLGLFLGSMFVVGTTSTVTQVFASTATFQEDERDEDEDEDKEEKKSKKKTKVPEAAEPSGDEGIEAGDTCVEISGEDIDGEEFSLSDYEGKVVMLDFWGDW